MKKNQRKFSKIDRLLEMPQEVYTDTPKITITGFNEMIIENFKGILEYEDYYIRINTSLGIVNINGYELKLELNIGIKDLKKVAKIAKQTKCKMKIIKKKGLPFLFNRYRKRKLFFVFLLVIIIGLGIS